MAIRVIQECVVRQGGLGAFITYGIGSTIQSLIDAGESSSDNPEIVVEVLPNATRASFEPHHRGQSHQSAREDLYKMNP